MARIVGINIPVNVHVVIALTKIFAIERGGAQLACQGAEVDPAVQVKDLTEPEVAKPGTVTPKFTWKVNLRRKTGMNISERMDRVSCGGCGRAAREYQ